MSSSANADHILDAEETFTVRAEDKRTGRVTVMKVKKGTPMNEVFRQYAERLGHGMDDLSFVADGKEVHPETTPDRLTEAPLPKSDRVITHDDVPGFPCAQMCMPGNLFGGQHSGIEGRGTD